VTDANAFRDYCNRHKKGLVMAGVTLGVLTAAGWAVRGRADTPQYLTARVEEGSITSVVQATGTINPLTTVPVGSYVSGTVKYIFADFNSRVQTGQVLAQLDPEIYDAQVNQARGNVENAVANERNLAASITAQDAAIKTNQANVERLKAAADYARLNTKRNLDLAVRGILPRDQADLSQSGLDQAEAQVRAAQAQLNQTIAQLTQLQAQLDQAHAQVKTMQGALDLAETNLRYCTIISPIDGTVVARNVTVGQSVAASLQAPIVFSIAQDLTRMQLYAATDESDTGNIKIGTEATFQVDAFPTQTFRGRVSAIRLNATTVQNVVTYNTIVDFENPDGKLLPGETAYATIPTGQVAKTLKIPNAAMRFTPSLPAPQLQRLYQESSIPAAATTSHLGGWQVVWRSAAGGRIRPVAVRVGITDYTSTQLVEGDLKAGDVLAIGEGVAGETNPGAPAAAPPLKFGAPRR
jgi:HlyD family secretion protein